MKCSRRDFLGKSILGMGAAVSFSSSWASATARSFLNDENLDVVIVLTARKKSFDLGEGLKSEFWTYEGKLLQGPASALQETKDSYLGPRIEVNTGDRVRIIFKNGLEEKSIVHWHGLDVSHENDGHPHFAVNPNGTYQYDFVVQNRAGMYWYHPHPHGRTGFQVYQGLAGLFIVRDQEEKSLNLPSGDQELQFVMQDRYFNEQGQLEYRPSMMGAFGNRLFINGGLNNKFKVKQGLYRVRLHNGCNARIFNLALSDGKEIKQIGSDGGLLRSVNLMDKFYFAPAERIDLLVDFSNYSAGETVKLEGLPLVEGNGPKYTVIEFEVTSEVGFSHNVPASLSSLSDIDPTEAVNLSSPKEFQLFPVRGVGWTINGNGYEANRYEDYEIIQFGDTEVWEFYNPTGMPHPMHIHGTQFQVLKRTSGQLTGCLDEGWKDVVLVMPGDRVQVIKRFDTFKGVFIYHCHNLEHEDMSMMRNFKIV